VVDVTDLSRVGVSLGARIEDTAYREEADLNGDGIIDIRDLSVVGLNYGATIPES